ncbi:MAG: hypothetical protein JY451_02065 [Erythrobacter sp.]|nr:MAG: hypothetical protein JY451_02065 [Erythrobacter sp.]
MEEESEPKADKSGARTDALSLTLFPTRLSIGPTRVLLNWRLELSNNAQDHIVSLRIWSDMVSAHGSIPTEEQLGGPNLDEARLHRIAMLAPFATESIAGEWQMPRDAVRPVDNAPESLILPLARFRLIGAGIAPLRRAFVIGNPPAPGEEKLRPLHLDGSLQVHIRLAARAVT